MKRYLIKSIKLLLTVVISLMICSGLTYANDGMYALTMSPMNQKIILIPGETYVSSFEISNPSSSSESLAYSISVIPFYVNGDYDVYYNEKEDYNQIVDWIVLDETNGILAPNTARRIGFTINVPDNPPAGGQYAAIDVRTDTSVKDDDSNNLGVNLKQSLGIVHIIYAEISGTSIKSGEVESINVPGFLLTGNVGGSTTVKNTGNVHDVAKTTLSVFPLFSNEELFTNEESDKNTMTILPDRSRYTETIWPQTPQIGIFKVIYTVEFAGMTQRISKIVIKCPIWLLFIIIFAIIALIMYFFVRSKNRKNNKKRAQSAKTE